ncbi:hypothetical protein E4U26_007743 [Claviceps purpurea]|nr:hypothetical protein E4U26_007743 [Claviceps purpurea]
MRAAAGPSKVVKPGFAAKLTKRGRRMAAESVNQNPTAGEGPLSNGKNLIFRLPQLCKGVSDDDMIDIVSDSLEGGAAPVGISPVKKGTWSVAFATIEDARASIGREIRFEPRFGCDPAQSVPLERYLTSAPQVFICDRQGPITNFEAQQMIANAELLKDNRFWYGAHKRRGCEGPKRVLVLESPPETTTMTFLGPGEYELRFRPTNRRGNCELCAWPKGEGHNTLQCPLLMATNVPENMPMRLEEMPAIVSTIFENSTPIIPKHIPIKITTLHCRSLDFHQLSDLCRWMVMEGIAVAALQEVRLFKPELSLAEKTIQNIKIWTHFDPKDPGSGIATLINTQLATVEDYKVAQHIYTDNGRRLLICRVKIGSLDLRVANVYCPGTEKNWLEWTSKCIKSLEVENPELDILCGDWNFTEGANDRTSRKLPGKGIRSQFAQLLRCLDGDRDRGTDRYALLLCPPGFKAKLTKRGKRLAAVVDDQQSQMKEIDEGAMIEIVMDSLEGGESSQRE